MRTLIIIMVVIILSLTLFMMAGDTHNRLVREEKMAGLEQSCNICLRANNVSLEWESENRFYSQVFVGSDAVTDDRLLVTGDVGIIEQCYSNCTIAVSAFN